MSLDENKQVVIDFFEAGNRGDMDRCIDLLAADVSWTDIGTTRFSGTYVGKENLAANLLGPLFDQLKGGIQTAIENVIAEGEDVVVQSTGQAETLDGKPYNNTYCHVMRVGKARSLK